MTTKKNELQELVDRINTLTGHGLDQYGPATSGVSPQAGVYGLEWAYGGVKLDRMSLDEGCTGTSDPLGGGFRTKPQLLAELRAFIAGLQVSA